jgi:triosephosphate isomerase
MAMKKIIVANWKMNPESLERAVELYQSVKKMAVQCGNVTTVICPPSVYVSELVRRSGKFPPGRQMQIGVQNVFGERTGAYTGEVSPSMAYSAGARYAIIGHSERRSGKSGCAETDEFISAKVFYSLKAELNVILCVGERGRDEHGDYLKTLQAQIEADIPKMQRKNYERLIIAYEPLWAIGKDAVRPATPEESEQIAIFIKKVLAGIMGKTLAMQIPILYGGSVDVSNAESFLRDGGVRGLLVGRESLDAGAFSKILDIADEIKG